MAEMVKPSAQGLVGHAPDLEELFAAARAGRLGHALLVTGPTGIGKFALLEALARGLLCEEGPAPACGVCPACRRVAAGAHPDLHRVDPVSEGFAELTIHFIAERENRPSGAFSGVAVESFLRLVAGEGGWRIVLVRDADRMNEETQNALLKTLEEPGPGVLLAMETSRPSALLPTIRSRVVGRRLTRLGVDEVAQVLERVAPELASDAGWLRLADGAPGRAVGLRACGAPRALEVLGQALRGSGDAPGLVKALLEVEGEFPGRTDRARDRERVRLWLDLGLELVRDLQRHAAGIRPADLVHGERLPDRAPVPAALGRLLEAWLEARGDLDLNLNPASVLERVLDTTLMTCAARSRRA